MPKTKLAGWNEAMYYFHLASPHYQKIFFVLDSRHTRRADSLASCYVRNYGHLIPADVEIIEYDMVLKSVRKVMHGPG